MDGSEYVKREKEGKNKVNLKETKTANVNKKTYKDNEERSRGNKRRRKEVCLFLTF